MQTLVASFIALLMCSNFILTSVPANNSDTARQDQLHAASSRFTFKLYNQILKQRTAGNTFISPASVMLALTMTYNGADGSTRDAMARTLELEGMNLDDVNRAFAELKSALNPSDPKIQLQIANSLWARKGLALKPAFVKRNKDYFEAEVTTVDFADPAAPQRINAWVNKNTEGKIDKIVDEISSDAVLYLINAIYFKGQWQVESKRRKPSPTCFDCPAASAKKSP